MNRSVMEFDSPGNHGVAAGPRGLAINIESSVVLMVDDAEQRNAVRRKHLSHRVVAFGEITVLIKMFDLSADRSPTSEG